MYADVELADDKGILLFGVFAVQLSMHGSSALTLGLPPAGQLTLLGSELLGLQNGTWGGLRLHFPTIKT